MFRKEKKKKKKKNNSFTKKLQPFNSGDTFSLVTRNLFDNNFWLLLQKIPNQIQPYCSFSRRQKLEYNGIGFTPKSLSILD